MDGCAGEWRTGRAGVGRVSEKGRNMNDGIARLRFLKREVVVILLIF